MLKLNKVHHIAIICSNYAKSKAFYTEVLGFQILKETFREHRNSYKLDLSLNGAYLIELFSFDNAPPRVTNPEANGLRHLAFEVDNVKTQVAELTRLGVVCEAIRVDETSGKKFTFFKDPDNLPLELYEQ